VTILVPKEIETDSHHGNNVENDEMPESGPIAGGLIRPTKYTWPYVTGSGLVLLIAALLLRFSGSGSDAAAAVEVVVNGVVNEEVVKTSSVQTQNTDKNGDVVMLSYIGFCLLVVGCAGIFDKLKAKSEMSAMWLRVAFAISAPTSLISLIRLFYFTLSHQPAESMNMLTKLFSFGFVVMNKEYDNISTGLSVLAFVTIPLVNYLVRFSGGWNQCKKYASMMIFDMHIYCNCDVNIYIFCFSFTHQITPCFIFIYLFFNCRGTNK
jgi:hypothetical protein